MVEALSGFWRNFRRRSAAAGLLAGCALLGAGASFAPYPAVAQAQAPASQGAASPGAASQDASSSETGPKSDWVKRCDDKGKCIIQTGLVDSQGKVVAMLAMTKHPEEGLMGELRTPLWLDLRLGLLAVVDDDKYKFRPTLITCSPRTCLSAFKATDERVEAMKKGGKLNVVFVEVQSGEKITLSFSLIGFTAKLKEFQEG